MIGLNKPALMPFALSSSIAVIAERATIPCAITRTSASSALYSRYSSISGEVLSPLINFAENSYTRVPLLDLLLGNGGGLIGTTSVIACIVGAILLSSTSVYDFYVPIISIASFVLAILFIKGGGGILPEVMSGSFIFASVYMLPAHSSSPALWPAKSFYAICFGVLCALVRSHYIFGEAGVFFCLLLVNLFAPLFDLFAGLFFRGRRVKKYE